MKDHHQIIILCLLLFATTLVIGISVAQTHKIKKSIEVLEANISDMSYKEGFHAGYQYAQKPYVNTKQQLKAYEQKPYVDVSPK